MQLSTLPSSHESPNQDLVLANSTAKIINSSEIKDEDVLALFEKLREGEFMLHGVKEEELVPSVMKTGVGNVTPESGFVSCWNSGSSPFGDIEKNGHHQTYGCCFFHYAHSYDRNPNSQNYTMTVAITNAETLRKFGIPIENYFKPDQEMNIPVNVPKEAIHFVRVEIPKDRFPAGRQLREMGEAGEAELFKGIRQVVDNFHPGTTTVIGHSAKQTQQVYNPVQFPAF